MSAPTALTATAGDGGAVLSWLAPAERGAITDDVESYAPWIIDGVGEWTMHDGDYDVTAYINYDAGQYENATARKAFQVLDVQRLGIDIWDEGKAHSGKRLLAALSSLNYVNDAGLFRLASTEPPSGFRSMPVRSRPTTAWLSACSCTSRQ